MKFIKDLMITNLGLLFVAVGICLFKIPNKFVLGGVSGLAIVLEYFFKNAPIGLIMLIINILLVGVGLAIVGFDFGTRTLYSSVTLSIMVWILQVLFPLNHTLTKQPLLELLYAILLPAIGTAIVFNQGSSTGGTDVLARILTKFTHIHVGKTLLIIDFFITLFAWFIFGIEIGMFCTFGLVIKAFLIDMVIEGLNLGKQVVIVSNKAVLIKEFIINNLKRGATVHIAEGGYSNEPKHVITTVVNRHQAIMLRTFVKNNDPQAFVTITNTSEIIGKGFRNQEL
jgi:uncharacterized membrane-anchored protein YitT (DUF2179 family)